MGKASRDIKAKEKNHDEIIDQNNKISKTYRKQNY
jgi:hypothetical protein